jgi:hypothetical protein
VRSLEIKTCVLRGAAILVNELCSEILGDSVEVGLVVSCCQTLGELLPGWGEAVVGFISTGPEGVTAGSIFWKGVDLENSIVRGNSLECDAYF